MPNLPRVSGAEVVRALERIVVRRHAPARQPHGSPARLAGRVVPNHRELKLGTLMGVPKQAGISADEFKAALR